MLRSRASKVGKVIRHSYGLPFPEKYRRGSASLWLLTEAQPLIDDLKQALFGKKVVSH